MLSLTLKEVAVLLRGGPVMVLGQDGMTKVTSFADTKAIMNAAAETLEREAKTADAPDCLGAFLMTEFDRLGDNWGNLGTAIEEGEALENAESVLAWYFNATRDGDPDGYALKLAGALPNEAEAVRIKRDHAAALEESRAAEAIAFAKRHEGLGSPQTSAQIVAAVFGSAADAAKALGFFVRQGPGGLWYAVTGITDSALLAVAGLQPTEDDAALAALVWRVERNQADALAKDED